MDWRDTDQPDEHIIDRIVTVTAIATMALVVAGFILQGIRGLL